jgi:hypothetical protein
VDPVEFITFYVTAREMQETLNSHGKNGFEISSVTLAEGHREGHQPRRGPDEYLYLVIMGRDADTGA